MDLVDEQHVVGLEVGQQRRQITGPLEHGPGRLAQIDAHLVGDDVRQRRLAESRRTENQHVVERLVAAPRRLDEDLHLLLDAGLPDVVGQRLRPYRAIEGPVLRRGLGVGQAVVFDAGHLVRRLPQRLPNDVLRRLSVMSSLPISLLTSLAL